MPQEFWANALFSVVPTILLLLVFWFLLRTMVRGDRTARRQWERIYNEEREKAGLPPVSAGQVPPSQRETKGSGPTAERD